jgi:hypothetical protein
MEAPLSIQNGCKSVEMEVRFDWEMGAISEEGVIVIVDGSLYVAQSILVTRVLTFKI